MRWVEALSLPPSKTLVQNAAACHLASSLTPNQALSFPGERCVCVCVCVRVCVSVCVYLICCPVIRCDYCKAEWNLMQYEAQVFSKKLSVIST